RLARGHRDAFELRFEPEPGQLARCMRQDVDANSDRPDLRRRLVDARRNSGAMQRQREGEAADAGADDDSFVHDQARRNTIAASVSKETPTASPRAYKRCSSASKTRSSPQGVATTYSVRLPRYAARLQVPDKMPRSGSTMRRRCGRTAS